MKIVQVCPYSAGACGVWSRVYSESKAFTEIGHSVTVISSNIVKATNHLAPQNELLEGIRIKRFPVNKSLSKKIIPSNVVQFNFSKTLEALNPDVIITHLLHPHSFQVLRIAKKLNIPCYLVTHAPFNVKRSYMLAAATKAFNILQVRRKLRQFTKVIAISKWEYPYLINLKVPKSKIIFIPNGLPEEYYKIKKNSKSKNPKSVLFLGRISSIKGLEVLVKAAKELPDFTFSLVGPKEEPFSTQPTNLINNSKNIRLLPPVYDLKEKIKLIDQYQFFVLPSHREAMPTVLLEAMARGLIVISSETDGGKEIIVSGKNGFLFPIRDYKSLITILKNNSKNTLVAKQAQSDATNYSWKKLIKKYEQLFHQ